MNQYSVPAVHCMYVHVYSTQPCSQLQPLSISGHTKTSFTHIQQYTTRHVHIHMCVYVYVYTHTHTYMYVHTHTTLYMSMLPSAISHASLAPLYPITTNELAFSMTVVRPDTYSVCISKLKLVLT